MNSLLDSATVATPKVYAEPPLRSGKVAIVGFATESMGAAPWDDPACEIWILNMLHAHVPRWDRLWEMHDRATVEQETEELLRDANHLAVLQAETVRPIYQVEPWADIPSAVRFPVETVTAWVATYCEKLKDTPYFTSTFGFMLAYAIMRIVERRADPYVPAEDEGICIAGVEMLNGEEYAYQRSNAEFLIGLAMGFRIPVDVPRRSALLESDGMYGYARAESLELLSRMRAYYKDKRQSYIDESLKARARREQHKAEFNTHHGVIQTVDWLLGQAGVSPELSIVLDKRRGDSVAAQTEAARLRDEAHLAHGIFEGSAQGVDWVVNHLTYIARGGKV